MTRMARLVIAWVVILLPLWGIRWLVLERERIETRERETCLERDLEQVMANFARLAEPMSHFQDLFQRVRKRLRWETDLAPLLQDLPQGVVTFWFFSRSGERISLAGEPVSLRNSTERCFRVLRRLAEDPEQVLSRGDESLLNTLLGSMEGARKMARRPGILVDHGPYGQVSRFAGIFPCRFPSKKKGFFIARVDSCGIDPFSLVKKVQVRLQRLVGTRFSFGVYDQALRQPAILTGEHVPLLRFPEVASGVRGNLPGQESGIVRTAESGRRFLLVGHAKGTLSSRGFFERDGFWVGLAAGLLAFLLIALRWLDRRFLPIRLQITGLFGLSGLVGIITLLSFAQVYRESRQEGLVRELAIRGAGILHKIDSDFLRSLGRIEKIYKSLVSTIRDPGREMHSFLRRLEHFRGWGNKVAVHLVDGSGKSLFRYQPLRSYVFGIAPGRLQGKLISDAARITIRDFNEGRTTEWKQAPSLGNVTEALASWASKNFLSMRGRLVRYNLDGRLVPLFSDLILDEAKKAVAILLITHPRFSLETGFLRSCRKVVRDYSLFDSFRFRVTALPSDGSRTMPPISREGFEEADLWKLNEVVSQTRSGSYLQGIYRGVPAILVTEPGRVLQEYNLVLVSPLRPILEKARTLERRFLFLAGLLLFFGISLGGLVTAMLLEPLSQVSLGINNLLGGRYSSPPRIRSGDILEEIGEGIGTIMTEMRELATARVIQEQLFPEAPLSRSGFNCQGWHSSPGEITGEIFDHQILADGRLAFWIAGTPDHTISSALILAMTRMGTRIIIEDRGITPGEVLAHLWEEVYGKASRLPKARMFLGLADLEAGHFSFASRGRFAVVHCRKGRGETWKGGILSMGSDGNEESSGEGDLKPGERLWACSEGIWAGGTIPDADLQSFLDALSGFPVENAGPRVLLSAIDPSLSQESTVSRTVLVLERKPETEASA